jgi:hypothetical protein
MSVSACGAWAIVERPTAPEQVTTMVPSARYLSEALLVRSSANHFRGTGRMSKTWVAARNGVPTSGETSVPFSRSGCQMCASWPRRAHPTARPSIAIRRP